MVPLKCTLVLYWVFPWGIMRLLLCLSLPDGEYGHTSCTHLFILLVCSSCTILCPFHTVFLSECKNEHHRCSVLASHFFFKDLYLIKIIKRDHREGQRERNQPTPP